MEENQNSPSTPKATELPLLIPEGIRYNCQGCGRCCAGWSVGLTHADYSRVKDVDWGSLHPDLASKELFIHREEEYKQGTAGYPHYTAPRPDGTCPFLIDGLCFIHGQFGEEAKPGTCQIFPYSFVETPTAVYMGVSLHSMAAVRNLGNLLTDQREALEDYWHKTRKHVALRARPEDIAKQAAQESAGQVSPFDTVRISDSLSAPWNEYLHLDNKLIELATKAEAEKAPIIRTLMKGEEIILEARRLVRQGKSLAELKDFETAVNSGKTTDISWTNETTIAMIYYLYLIYPTVRASHQELWQAKRQFTLKSLKPMSRYLGSGISTIIFKRASIPGIGSVDLSKALNYKVEPLSPEINTLFSRWLLVKLFSKTSWGPAANGYSVYTGYNSLIAYFICAMLFAKGECMKRGDREVKIADLYEGIWRLDKEYLTASQVSPQVTNGLAIAYSMPRIFRGHLDILANTMSP